MKIPVKFVRVFLIVISLAIFCSSQSFIALADSIHEPPIVAQSDSSEDTLTIRNEAYPENESLASYCDGLDPTDPNPVTSAKELIRNLGNLNFPVTSPSKQAKNFFNQGLTLFYNFNNKEAIRFFMAAAEKGRDPEMAMAYYGMALAVGTNINVVIDERCQEFAYKQIQNALTKMDSNKDTTDLEKALIRALSVRYPKDKLNNEELRDVAIAYKNAMAKVYEQYSDQPDVVAIYVDSLMNLYPWRLWSPYGRAATPVTKDIVSILEKGLRTSPDHIGMNHYYIHAIEASTEPQKALASATKFETLAPAAGHLVHMSSHIYARVGDYEKAAKSNEKAIKADKPYVDRCLTGKPLNINDDKPDFSDPNCDPIYTGSYYSHNLLFEAVSDAMVGQSKTAIDKTQKVVEHVSRYLQKRPRLEHFLPSKILMLERFRKWDDIIKNYSLVPLPIPGINHSIHEAFRHWALAMAYLGKEDLDSAKIERSFFNTQFDQVSNDVRWKNNRARDLLEVAAWQLEAKFAYLENKADDAIYMLMRAVSLQDNLAYVEPIPWTPLREALGTVLYLQGRYQEAQQVFEEDLAKNGVKADYRTHSQNGRSLFGLYKTLDAQGKHSEARQIEAEFNEVWKKADVELTMLDLF